MKRRTLLHAAASTGAVALAGCISDGGGPGAPGTDAETTDEPSDDTPDGTTDDGEPTGDGVSLAETEFEILDAGCGTERNVADVTTDEAGGVVTVDGTVTASSGCYTAKLAGATYGAEADSVLVDVVTERRSDVEACVQCLTEIDYRVRLSFDGGLPGRVAVTHDGTQVCDEET